MLHQMETTNLNLNCQTYVGYLWQVKNEMREKGLQIKFLRSTVLHLFIETIIFHEFKS